MIQNVVLIGSGNLATQLGMGLAMSGFNIRQVYSKSIKNASILADKLNAYHTDQLNEIQKKCDLYIIAVSDSALESVIADLPNLQGIVVHTSGSMASSILNRFDKFGTFYPFQTFSKDKAVDFNQVPCLIEGKDQTIEIELMTAAKKISKQVISCDSEQRKQIHLAAVFACNFSNHLYKIAFDLLESNNINPDVIKPLINETAHKIQSLSPIEAQTGPAMRKDDNIINMQKDMLNYSEELKSIYSLFTDRIYNQK
ncbi:Rossmann-like and DUF2520 domain-containing protein [Saccharicrinis aurantiacus]|uniref:Rossmann-like and DUF2520 domain-containing protein n=1 Tax=Saccharicrinis aurantiacus TaxID=1849719 RepID=UPI002491A474|nr:Rossmann-like and DUF2520 domain-containing protein [Saccharicrinis aurantiacus]